MIDDHAVGVVDSETAFNGWTAEDWGSQGKSRNVMANKSLGKEIRYREYFPEID